MKGLIKKDLLMARGNIKTLSIIVIVFALMSLNGDASFAYIATYLCVVLMMSTFSYDEFNKSDAYIQTLPKGKTNAVKAKYVTTFILVLFATVFSISIAVISAMLSNSLDILGILLYSFGNLMGVMTVMAIFYPIIYKFGIEKSRIIIFVFVFFIVGVSMMFSHFGLHIHLPSIPSNVSKIFENYGDILVLITSIIVLISSYNISKKIYSKKEF